MGGKSKNDSKRCVTFCRTATCDNEESKLCKLIRFASRQKQGWVWWADWYLVCGISRGSSSCGSCGRSVFVEPPLFLGGRLGSGGRGSSLTTHSCRDMRLQREIRLAQAFLMDVFSALGVSIFARKLRGFVIFLWVLTKLWVFWKKKIVQFLNKLFWFRWNPWNVCRIFEFLGKFFWVLVFMALSFYADVLKKSMDLPP